MSKRAEAKIVTTLERMETDEARAQKSREAWENAVYEGNTQGGVTYERCAELSRKSRSRIDQVLRAARRRNGKR
jgi:hypothetical protein